MVIILLLIDNIVKCIRKNVDFSLTLLYFKGDKTVQPQGSESQSIGRSGDEDSDKENHPADGGDKAVAQGDTDASPAGEGADTLKKVGNIL